MNQMTVIFLLRRRTFCKVFLKTLTGKSRQVNQRVNEIEYTDIFSAVLGKSVGIYD
jgi:hypothetical protein